MSGRNPEILGRWGPKGTRIVASESMWKMPLLWNKRAGKEHDEWMRSGDHEGPSTLQPERPRVFCASLADVFEDWQGPMVNSQGVKLWQGWDSGGVCASEARPNPRTSPMTMTDVRRRLFETINATPNLDWLLLTKRPEYFRNMLPDRWLDIKWPDNVWLGVSVENQEMADERIPLLLQTPAKVKFLSVEPMLEDINLNKWLFEQTYVCRHCHMTFQEFERKQYAAAGILCPYCSSGSDPEGAVERGLIHWVICGGESGGGARPFNVDWARSIRDQCRAAGVAFFMKQFGSVIDARNIIDPIDQFPGEIRSMKQGPDEHTARISLIDKKGGDMSEWPHDLMVREMPK